MAHATVEVGRRIEIPAPRFTRFSMTIKGATPLITDNFSESAKDKLRRSQGGEELGKNDPRDPEREFEDSIYLLPDGGYGFPATGLKKAIKNAAIRLSEHKGTEVIAAFSIEADLLRIDAGKPKRRDDHVVRNGKGNMAYRAEFWPWSMTVPVRLYEPALSVMEFLRLVQDAGSGIGIGNWRAERNGNFGLWDLISAETETT